MTPVRLIIAEAVVQVVCRLLKQHHGSGLRTTVWSIHTTETKPRLLWSEAQHRLRPLQSL